LIDEPERFIVDVYEFAILQISRVVNAPTIDVTRITLIQNQRLTIFDERSIAGLGKKLHAHLAFNDDGHVVAWVRVRRLRRPFRPLFHDHLHAVWIFGRHRKTRGESIYVVGDARARVSRS
jgi:hypothetical protein